VSELDEMGPIDYIVVEWPGKQPTGQALPHLVELVDLGLIRIIDLAFIAKDEDGTITVLDINELGETLAVFDGASSGLLGDDDISEAGGVLEPGTSAAILVWENRWAAPFASAVRRGGGQLVASGRIPVQALVAALEAAEAAN
jgi:hypothetical protein